MTDGAYTACEGCGGRIDDPDDPTLVGAAKVVRKAASQVGVEELEGQRVLFHESCWPRRAPGYMLRRAD